MLSYVPLYRTLRAESHEDLRGRNVALAAAVFAGTGKQKPATASMEEKAAYPKIELAPKVQPLPITRSSSKNPPRNVERNDLKQPNRDRGQLPSQRPDVTPIQATNTLVKLFESHTGTSNSSSKSNLSRPRNLPLHSTTPPKVALATGEKPIELSRPKTAEGASNRIKVAKPPIRELETLSLSNACATATARAADSITARPETSKRTISHRGPPPTPPPPRRTRQDKGVVKSRSNVRSSIVNDSDGISSASSYASALDVIQPPPAYGRLSPTLELARTQATRSSGQAERSLSANNLSSSRQQKSPRITCDSDRDDNVMALKRSLREGPLLSNGLTPQQSAAAISLAANAIVAPLLASSRAPSPSKPAPPLPRRPPKPHSLFIRSQSQEQVASRTPSPGRGMRQTMRESLKPDDDDADDDEFKKRRGYLLRKHHNKYHEGNRKQWRDEITEGERKRYEGVWAANRGLCMPPNDPKYMNSVVNGVVQDIWRRSRLPEDVLEEIWDLVDPEGEVCKLSKEQFVVGLWLIDQRLKGRKLPMKVSESVWSSVRGLSGIKVSKNPR